MRTWNCSRERRRENISASCRKYLTNHAESVIALRHLTGGIQLRDNGDQRRLNNRNLRTRTHLTVKIDDVDRAHANAAVTCRPANIPLFRSSMNINVAAKCIRILSFSSAQPDDSRYDRVAPRRVHWNYFAGPASIFENRSSRSAVANFVRDLQFTQRRTITAGAIT